jgi:HTH-type transcriptional regulator/antitoxin HipB
MTTTTLHYADQLSTLLRSLRKRRKLTQAQLGELLGVSQARVAELEAKPGVVGVAQMIKVLAALGGTFQLIVHDELGAAQTPAMPPDPAESKPKNASFKREAALEHRVSEPNSLENLASTRHGKKGTW